MERTEKGFIIGMDGYRGDGSEGGWSGGDLKQS